MFSYRVTAILLCIALVSLPIGCIDKSNATSESKIDIATGKLPTAHPTFELIKRNFYDSQIDDFNNIDLTIWKRPEFYPTWERSGIPTFTDHDYSRWGVHGYGFFPSVESWNAHGMMEGDSITFYVFLHTAWGVETWQGMKLIPVHNNTLFDVKVTPDEFYLEPTFPVFYPEWTKKIEFTVTAKQEIPIGTHPISVDVSVPDDTKTEVWSWEILDKYTEQKYHSAIESCKENADSKMCDDLIKLRQNKYVKGNMFTPSNGFVSYIVVS
jgi:hypothetical protein